MSEGKAFMIGIAIVASLIIVVVLISEVMNLNTSRSHQDTAENRIHRVVVDDQECMVLTQFSGKIIALDCNWGEE